MPTAKKAGKPASASPLKDRLKAAGLKLKPSDLKVLETMAAELELSAAAVRKDRSYFEEPIHTLRLRPA